MKPVLLIVFLIAHLTGYFQESGHAELIEQMAKIDRLERMRVAEAVQTFGRDAKQTALQWKRIATLDSIHSSELYSLMHHPGFKQVIGMSGETAHGLWLLVMHQDHLPELQETLLRVMMAEKGRGNVILSDMAFLTDRLAVNRREPQVFGTQTYYDEERDRYVLFEVEKRGLKRRRRSVSLMPLRRQLKQENKRHSIKF